MSSMDRRRAFTTIAALAVALPARAQTYPSRPIQCVVGYPPGSATDFIVRVLTPHMAQGLGQPVVIENKPGASGVLAATYVARAPADGYTIMASVPASITTARAMLKDKLQYKPETDLVPICLIGVAPLVLVASPSSGIKSVADLLKAANATARGLNIGSYGVGSPPHFAIETLRVHAKLPVVHIPHNGAAAMQTALLGGVVPVAMDSITTAMPMINSGKVVPLATISPRRHPLLPQVPTAGEAGLGEMEIGGWAGLHAPRGTPDAIVQRLNTEVNRVLEIAEVRTQLAQRVDIVGGSPRVFQAHVEAETQRLMRIAQDAGMGY